MMAVESPRRASAWAMTPVARAMLLATAPARHPDPVDVAPPHSGQ
jgi:hypothetical protein